MSVFFTIFTVIILFFLAGMVLLRHLSDYEKKWILTVLFVALVIRMGLSFIYIEFMGKPELTGPDTFLYIRGGYGIVDKWNGLDYDKRYYSSDKKIAHPGYIYTTAVFYFVFGKNISIPAYFNALMGVLLIMLLARLFLTIFAWGVVKNFILIMAFLPSSIIWNAAILKDTIILFMVTVAFYSYFQVVYRHRLSYIPGAVLPLVPLYFIRFYIVLVLIAVYLFSVFVNMSGLSIRKTFQGMAIALGMMAVLFAFGLGSDVSNVVDKQVSVEQLNKYQRGLSYGKTELYEDQHYETGFDIIKYFPVRLVHFLFSPFPWQVVSLNSALGAFEVPLLWLLSIFVVRGLFFCLRHPRAREFLPIIIYFIFLTVLYAIVESNIGTIYRMRYQILPFYIIMASIGLSLRKAHSLGVNSEYILSRGMRNIPVHAHA